MLVESFPRRPIQKAERPLYQLRVLEKEKRFLHLSKQLPELELDYWCRASETEDEHWAHRCKWRSSLRSGSLQRKSHCSDSPEVYTLSESEDSALNLVSNSFVIRLDRIALFNFFQREFIGNLYRHDISYYTVIVAIMVGEKSTNFIVRLFAVIVIVFSFISSARGSPASHQGTADNPTLPNDNQSARQGKGCEIYLKNLRDFHVLPRSSEIFVWLSTGIFSIYHPVLQAVNPFANLVTFPSTTCDTSDGRSGICYKQNDCKKFGGQAVGSCAHGFGVCCVRKKKKKPYIYIIYQENSEQKLSLSDSEIFANRIYTSDQKLFSHFSMDKLFTNA